MSRLRQFPILARCALCAPILLTACAQGGEEDRPSCEVKLNGTSLHLFAMVARPDFSAFPTPTGDAGSIDGRILLTDDCTYELDSATGDPIGRGDYALESDGTLSILVPTNSSTLVYRGAYGLEGDTRHTFLTDRVGSAVGLYIGTERVVGNALDVADMAGDWHLFMMHARFPPATAPRDQDQVGLALSGKVTLAADGSMTGSGAESEAGTVSLRADPADFKTFADGRATFEVTVDPTTKPDYDRGFVAGGDLDFLAALDPLSSTDDEVAGLSCMMRLRDANDYTPSGLVGTYKLGLWTLFLAPDASGCDAAVGTLELTANGDLRIQATSNRGVDFSYSGTYTAAADGTLTISISGTNQTWTGAFDQSYDTVLLLDAFKESRPNGQAELNFGFAIRPVPASN